jgi:hypothetical protein
VGLAIRNFHIYIIRQQGPVGHHPTSLAGFNHRCEIAYLLCLVFAVLDLFGQSFLLWVVSTVPVLKSVCSHHPKDRLSDYTSGTATQLFEGSILTGLLGIERRLDVWQEIDITRSGLVLEPSALQKLGRGRSIGRIDSQAVSNKLLGDVGDARPVLGLIMS